MIMRWTSLICATGLAACGGGGGSTDIEGTLVFADQDDLTISRLMNSAGGTDMFSAMAQVEQMIDPFEEDPCPAITIDGNTVTVTGGCTRLDGLGVEGSATITNPAGVDEIEFDYNDDIVYDLVGFQLVQAGTTVSYDGVVVRSDGLTTWDADVTVAQSGLEVRSDLYYHCSNPNNPRCSLSGSGIELTGEGGATVSGSVELDGETQTQVTELTLEGVDTLTVEIRGGCVAWAISGTDRGMDCPGT
jgi:hypothetical protein